ncbi:type II toxin-antitoxin system VapC family toxin [bacterium]|nr:type II toxin-antitoxin system VapC family toxin [bacterium]MBU1599034.1 type II toxin-antitoxin system VapC family toxin [bacterium]MBU2461479.1 type II toxin-antitoxin system VapC family toxin [bacterium]
MRLLLDTHTFLWFIDGNPKLTSYARQLIEELTNKRFLSVASLWEMSIKNSLGRLKLPLPFTKLVAEQVYGNAIKLLHIAPEYLDVLRTLPFYHKDPFDRLIIAQSMSEDIPVLSRDEAFDDYAIRRFWNRKM